LKDGLKSGSILYIPASSPSDINPESKATQAPVTSPAPVTTPVPTTVAKDKKYKKHTAKWYENIYDVAQKYKVPVDALVDINGLGEDTVLKKRQVLLIPDKEYITDFNRRKNAHLNNTPKNPDITTFPSDNTKEEYQDTTSVQEISYPEHRSYKVTLILPFDGNNQMDFYSGALVAFRDFKEATNTEYTLNVINTNEYPSIQSVIASGKLEDSEVIIGPILEKDLSPIAQWANENNTPLVSPLDPKASYLTDGNPNFIQFAPTVDNLIDYTYSGIIEDGYSNGDKPLVIYEKWTRHSKLVTTSINSLLSNGIEIDTLGYGILEGRGIDAVMLEKLDTTNTNTVFVVSENEAFVSDALRNLHLAKGNNGKINIHLFGLPKWKNYEILELAYLHELNSHLALQYYIDYTNPETTAFIETFRYNFKTDPTQYAFQGYDVTSYFLSVLHQYGRSFPAHLDHHEKSLLQSNIKLKKADNRSGFVNTGIREILYSGNWSIKAWE
jgi:LysM repeat protein